MRIYALSDATSLKMKKTGKYLSRKICIPSKNRGNAISMTHQLMFAPFSQFWEKVPEGRMRVSSDGTHLAHMLRYDNPIELFQ